MTEQRDLTTAPDGAGAADDTPKPKGRRVNDPTALATRIIEQHFLHGGHERTLQSYRDEFWEYRDGRYREVQRHEMEGFVYRATNEELVRRNARDKDGYPFMMTANLVQTVLMALRSKTLVPGDLPLPVGVGKMSRATGYISMQNGLVHLPTLLAGHRFPRERPRRPSAVYLFLHITHL